MLEVLPSELAQALLYINGPQGFTPLRLKNYKYILPIYDSPHPWKLIKAGRGVAKSVTLAAKAVVESIINPGYSTLYISASHPQVRDFSHLKLDPFLESPLIRKYWFDPYKCLNNVYTKELLNGSTIIMRAVYRSAERVRGLHVGFLLKDELELIPTKSLPIINEVLTGVSHTAQIESGTPLSLENPLESRWQASSQNIWVIKCEHCSHLNDRIEIKQITRTGLICKKCEKPISPQSGCWVPMVKGAAIDGYEIPQILLPILDWEQLFWKCNNLSSVTIENELMGRSSEMAGVPITKSQIMQCCDPKLQYQKELTKVARSYPCFMGLDWGTGQKSFTVLTIMNNLDGKPTIIYQKRYKGVEAEIEYMFRDILARIEYFKPRLICSDWGFGTGLNSRLLEKFKEKVFIIQSTAQTGPAKYDIGISGYRIGKNRTVADFLEIIKNSRIRFPNWEDFQFFGQDILNERIEYNEERKIVNYFSPEDKPDDALWSAIYSWFGFALFYRIKH